MTDTATHFYIEPQSVPEEVKRAVRLASFAAQTLLGDTASADVAFGVPASPRDAALWEKLKAGRVFWTTTPAWGIYHRPESHEHADVVVVVLSPEQSVEDVVRTVGHEFAHRRQKPGMDKAEAERDAEVIGVRVLSIVRKVL